MNTNSHSGYGGSGLGLNGQSRSSLSFRQPMNPAFRQGGLRHPIMSSGFDNSANYCLNTLISYNLDSNFSSGIDEEPSQLMQSDSLLLGNEEQQRAAQQYQLCYQSPHFVSQVCATNQSQQDAQIDVEDIFQKAYMERVLNQRQDSDIPAQLLKIVRDDETQSSNQYFNNNNNFHQDEGGQFEEKTSSTGSFADQSPLHSEQPFRSRLKSKQIELQINSILSAISVMQNKSKAVVEEGGRRSSYLNDDLSTTPTSITSQPRLAPLKQQEQLQPTKNVNLGKFLTKKKHSPKVIKKQDEEPRSSQADEIPKVSPKSARMYKAVEAYEKVKASKSPTLYKTKPVALEKDEYLNQDLISRLFLNHKKSQEIKDQKLYVHRQLEMKEVKAAPSISPRSRQIALQSQRFAKPIYSPKRYQQEIDTYMARKEEDKRQKWINTKNKEEQEDREIQINSVHSETRLLSKTQFLRKYNNQVRIWQQRTQGPSTDHSPKSKTPEINKKSKDLAKHVQKIEQRVSILQQSKQRKVEQLAGKLTPNFTPSINKNSQMLASQSRKSVQQIEQYFQKAKIERISKLIHEIKDGECSEKVKHTRNNKKLVQAHSAINLLYNPKLGMTCTLAKDYSPIIEKRPYVKPQKLISKYENTHIQQPVKSATQDELAQNQGIISIDMECQLLPSRHQRQRINKNLEQSSLRTFNNNTSLHESPVAPTQIHQKQPDPLFLRESNENDSLMQEYIKLKKEFDEQLSNRVSLSHKDNIAIFEYPSLFQAEDSNEQDRGEVSENEDRKSIVYRSKETSLQQMEVFYDLEQEAEPSYLASQQSKNDIKNSDSKSLNMSETKRMSISHASTMKILDPHQFANLKEDTPTSENFSDQDDPLKCQTIDVKHAYQTSPLKDHLPHTYTLSSSAGNSSAVEFKNFQLSSLQPLQPKSIGTVQRQSALSQQNHKREPSKEITEVESIINNIKHSIDLLSAQIQTSLPQPHSQAVIQEEDNENSMSQGQLLASDGLSLENRSLDNSTPKKSQETGLGYLRVFHEEMPSANYKGFAHLSLAENSPPSNHKLKKSSIEEIAPYIDDEARELIEEEIATGQDSKVKCGDNADQSEVQSDIIQRILLQNQQLMNQEYGGSDMRGHQRKISVSRQMIQEIKDRRLDSVSIIKSVIQEFQGVLQLSQKKIPLFEEKEFVTFSKQ